ncbi:PAAR domain-containing protein [Rouxiella silvae]
MTRRLAKLGDKTTHGQINSASSTIFDQQKALVLSGDKAWCGRCKDSYEIIGTYTGWFEDVMLVGEGDYVSCRCTDNQVYASSDYFGESDNTAPSLPYSMAEPEVLHYAQAHKPTKLLFPVLNDTPLEPLLLPARIYETINKMDDYAADDMHYGDLTEAALKIRYGLTNVSVNIDPFNGIKKTHRFAGDVDPRVEVISLEQSAAELFDQFRDLSDAYSWQGEYQGLIRKMITHMQHGEGAPFQDPLLDKAMKERILNDKSAESSLLRIKKILAASIDYENGYFPLKYKNVFQHEINERTILPKFDKYTDRINGLGISVHDTWATHITLSSLQIEGDNFSAEVHFHIQDHFGLDDKDVLHPAYRQFRIFRIWFALQRWENFYFKPFITDINIAVRIRS